MSEHYFPDRKITLYAGEETYDGKIMYLSVFNNTRWIPMAWSKVKGDSMRFRHMEPGIAYIGKITKLRAKCGDAEVRTYNPDCDEYTDYFINMHIKNYNTERIMKEVQENG